jgi:rhamnosyltransferase
MLRKKSVLAIVVTYHPDGSFADRFEVLVGQVGGFLVVDNHSDASSVSMLREAAERLKMELILNSENLGQAAALNIGIEHAVAFGYEWALLFDQDTTPGQNMFEGLREAYGLFPRKEKLAVMGSNYIEPDTGKPRFSSTAANGCSWRTRRVVITSGSLVSLAIYRILGRFRDEYFIDCVDLEYCLRARSKGFEVIATTKPLMVHGIGQPTHHRFPWRTVNASNHSDIRRYYMIRNSIDLTKKYLLYDPAWVLANLWTRLKSVFVLCMFEEDRWAKIKWSLFGIFDGFMSRFGKRSADQRRGNAAPAGTPAH